ncbi:Complex I intermediate-associated protein 30 [Synechococcus sp. PCC 7335]|uniref:CIA30 family protein n=1 Tax=Synechococcus sp. (strain ATCC 29403 / PCC 7335) TaxID=91464 RepID=UPI00017ECE57|nr:CIA30 family protein [Synechococcus sp. PCC 7335]EDX83969.1 Complex I intermediate-associated protein 30 [Synechococcus sp. PCC 7335]
MTQTPSENRAQWDVTRFVQTLNNFGEIPFLGSFRWLQQLLGQAKTFAGKSYDANVRKVAILGDVPSEKMSLLLQQFPTDTQIETFPEKTLKVAMSSAEGRQLMAQLVTADTIVIGEETAEISAVLIQLEEERKGLVVEPIFDFSKPGCNLAAWGALDDVVMGGVSQGQIALVNSGQPDQHVVFAGVVSTENSGGFSSVRTQNFEPAFDFSGWLGLQLAVKGDGQRYKFILRNSAGWDSPAYIYGFDTVADKWIDVDVPFSELVPTFRARTVPSASPYDPAKTVSFQLMLSKFEYDRQLNSSFTAGPFKLAVKQIGLYRSQEGETVIRV